MGKVYKVGELVYFSPIGEEGGYAIIDAILDIDTGVMYAEKNVITGYGEKNTRVVFKITVLTHSLKTLWDVTSPLVELSHPVEKLANPHNIIKANLNQLDKLYKKALYEMNNRMSFVRKHSINITRENKINDIVNE